MDAKGATRILHKIYQAIKENFVKVYVRRMEGTVGWCRWEDEYVAIYVHPDDRKINASFLSTVIHECIHMIYSDLREREVLRMEKEVFELLTDRQLTNLLKRIAERAQ